MSQKRRVEYPISAGGVVYRIDQGRAQIVICGRNKPLVWGLPKGTPDLGETLEETALREVREETGLDVEIERFIKSIKYCFSPPAGDVLYYKTVCFYLMFATGGELFRHDHEFDSVKWVHVEEASRALTYENEVRVVQEGLSMASEKARAG